MSSDDAPRARRNRAVARTESKVRFLELFFDLVFVLAFTQSTALIVEHPTWEGVLQGMFVLALLWWAWGGYAWLTSTVDPEEGLVRFAMFGAMAALLIVALSVPEAFGERALPFAIAYGVVRFAQIALFALASQDDTNLRSSVTSLGVSSGIGVGLIVAASFLDGVAQMVCWAVAILIDFGGPALFGVAGWRLIPAHFAERYGLIIILALGESIVVLGVGAHLDLSAGLITAGILGVALASALWWAYFDVVAIVTEERLTSKAPGREQNAFARDSYSYLHLPMAAGIVLVAAGLENTVAHYDESLGTVMTFALQGGVALYLLAHVALRLRGARTVNYHRLFIAIALIATVPLGRELPALWTLVAVNVVIWAMIAYETLSYGAARAQVRSRR
jgi:low temperature requirement protein LtrA